MPRRARVFVAGAIYHVYCRTARREPVFADSSEAAKFVEILRKVKQQDNFAILAWCLMPNHYHLVLRTAEVPLWRSMRLIQGCFAQEHNLRHGTLGSLWQERFKARVIDSQAYLGQVLAYVHLNPVTARLAASPGAWRWSGHRELLSPGGATLVDVDEAWLLLGKTVGEARKAYRSWLTAVRKAPLPAEPMGSVPWWQRGSPDDEKLVVPGERPRVDALGVSSVRNRPRLDVETYLARAAAGEGLSIERLGSPVRDQATVRAREAIVLVGVERYGLRCRDLAAALGRSADQVSRWAGQASRRKARDEAFRRRMETLDDAIANASIHAGAARP